MGQVHHRNMTGYPAVVQRILDSCGKIMEEPLVTSLAEKYGVSPARICLKYAVERGVMPIPKASTAERMKENMDLFSFEMEKEDIYRLATMPQAGWSGEHPDRETVPAE